MKRLLWVLLVGLCCSCSKEAVADAGLEGNWVLVRVSCFCFFGPETNFRQTTLTFDTDSNRVTVNSNGDMVYFKPTGTYSYSGNGNQLEFEDGRAYTFDISESELRLDFVDEPNIADDEVSYTFERN